MRMPTFISLIANGCLDASKINLQKIRNFSSSFEGLNNDSGVELLLQLSETILESLDCIRGVAG